MVSFDIQELIQKYLADGFTINSLCKSTNAPLELINRACTKQNLTAEECTELKPVLYFLMQLYACNVGSSKYFEDMAAVISEYFDIPKKAVSAYCGLDEMQYEAFLRNPKAYPNGYDITIRFLHLFNTLVREKSI